MEPEQLQKLNARKKELAEQHNIPLQEFQESLDTEDLNQVVADTLAEREQEAVWRAEAREELRLASPQFGVDNETDKGWLIRRQQEMDGVQD